MNACLLGALFVASLAYINCASIADCDTEIPAAPIVPVVHTVTAPVAPPVVAPVIAPADENVAVYHKGPYGGLGQTGHPYWGHPGVWGHHAVLGHHGLWGHHGVLAHPSVNQGLGGYATGPVDINTDGAAYTGPEDDQSPIAGGPVYHTRGGEAKWHGPYQGPVVHAPIGGYGAHHVLPHPFAYGAHNAITHPGIVTGHSPVGVVAHHGLAVGLHPHLPASTHFGVVNTHDLAHSKLGDYIIGDIKDLKKEDCPPEIPAVVFDKSSKSDDTEAAPVADATPAEDKA